MIGPRSRYARQPTYTVTLPDGRTVQALVIPAPRPPEASAGLHRNVEGDRLDLLAARYLGEPTQFWRLCDLNDASVPAALEARPFVAIPRGGRK